MKKVVLGFILGGLIFGSIGIYAASYYAKDVSYEPSDASWEVSNVNDAINSLYEMSLELDNSGSGIVDLGLGTSFDIKTLAPNVDYKNLTKDSFIVECINNTVTSNGFLRDNLDSTWHWVKASVSIDKSYDATTGILTVSCIYHGLVYSSGNGNVASAKSTNNVHVYLMY